MTTWGPIYEKPAQKALLNALNPLKDTPVSYLRLPANMAAHIEPSQVGTIVGTLTDLMLPRLALEKGIGLSKAAGLLGDREGYPDFEHDAGYRVELKGVFRDNPKVKLKKPPTPREPSARLTQKVTVKNVIPETDALLVLVYQLAPLDEDETLLSPTITGVGIFPVIECVRARDQRMITAGGKWFGNYETPTILSRIGKAKQKSAQILNDEQYGRKESEGWDYNEDTNFGKLKRIPYQPLQEFLRASGCQYASGGNYPAPWSIGQQATQSELAFEVSKNY